MFLQRTEKLDAGSQTYEKEKQAHEYLTWLEERVRRARSLQVVTHPLKATYPDAHVRETDSLFCPPESLTDHGLVATASLGNDYHIDATGNAASLDAYRLLTQNFEGSTLLQLCLEADEDMQSALHPDPDIGRQWLINLADITQPKTSQITSHGFAKQIYWFVGDDPDDDGQYVLLQPMFSSPLAHQVFLCIQEDRFGDAAKEARKARNANQPSEQVLHIYPDLSVQVLGGSNPQNISSLNSTRRGTNYLLSSCPPIWRATGLRPLLFQDTAFRRFAWRNSARWGWDAHYWLNALREFLATKPDPTKQTRARVNGMLNGLIGELLVFTHAHHDLESGWSSQTDCHLPLAQKLWLDPKRVLEDDDFAQEWQNISWEDEVEASFGQWVNHQLGQTIDFLGDVEFRRWAKELRNHSAWKFSHTKQGERITTSKKGAI